MPEEPPETGRARLGKAASGKVTVVGVQGNDFAWLAREAHEALAGAALVVGGTRLLAAWSSQRSLVDASPGGPGARQIDLTGDLPRAMAEVAEAHRRGESVVVLASGDPGFFGILRALLSTLDRQSIRVVPHVSSVAMAFARLGLPWDDAVVVSAHGRPLEEALGAIRIARKVAVLTSPDTPPEVIGRALKRTGASVDLLAVCSRLGFSDEEVVELGLDDLASGKFDPLSVVVVVGPGGLPIVGWDSKATLAWGLDQGAFRHRAGMVTKAEVRAVILGKLALPTAGVLWDIGAGSGSVGIECARLSPGLTVFAVEKNPEDAQRVVANASSLDAGVHVVEGTAPEALVRLPDPDRVFVGGGGLEVLDEVLARLRPGGRVVASFAALDRATGAAERLGSLVQIGLSRAAPLPDGSWRLSAENPVFIAWGPNLGALDTGQA